jgi:hypothetical protein
VKRLLKKIDNKEVLEDSSVLIMLVVGPYIRWVSASWSLGSKACVVKRAGP